MPAPSSNTQTSDDSQTYDITDHLSDQEVENALGITAGRELRQEFDGPPSPKRIMARVAELEPQSSDWSVDEVQAWLQALKTELTGAPAGTRRLVREKAKSILEDVEAVSAAGAVADSYLLQAAEAKPDTGPDDTEGQGSTLSLDDPPTVSGQVSGASVLTDLRETFNKYLVLPDGADVALALWTLHAHAHDAAQISPILAVTSPEPRCGKTTLLEILGTLVPRPLPASNITAASLFRSVEKFGPTLLVDEADTYLEEGSQLRGVLNSGHSRHSAYIVRSVGEDHEPRMFKTWAPKAVALIGDLPDTLDDRSVEIRMRRKAGDDDVARLRRDRLDRFENLRRRAWTWAERSRGAVAEREPEVPSDLHDRARDNWRTLLSISEVAGGEWVQRARNAAVSVEDDGAGTKRSEKVKLLEDLEEIFRNQAGDDDEEYAERLRTRTIRRELARRQERPWAEYNYGDRISARQLADLLRPFDVRPRTLRFGDGDDTNSSRAKGYRWKDLNDPVSRYTPASGRDNRDSRDIPGDHGGSDDPDSRDTPPDVTASEPADDPGDVGNVTGVTANPPDIEGRDEEGGREPGHGGLPGRSGGGSG